MKYSAKGITVFRYLLIWMGTIIAALIATAIPSQATMGNDDYSLSFSEDGLLSLNAKGAALEKILSQIQSEMKVQYRLSQEHLGKSIYASFRRLPVHEAIKKILHGISYACIMAPNGNVSEIITFSNTGPPVQAQSSQQEPLNLFSSEAEPISRQKISADIESASRRLQAPAEVLEALEEVMEPVPPPDVVSSNNE